MQTAPPPTTHRCTRCHRVLPLHFFRARRRDDRRPSSRCHQCHAADLRDIRRVARQKAAGKQLNRFVERVRRAKTRKQVIAATAEIIDRLGGIDAFVDRWLAVVDANPTGRAAASFFQTMARIILACGRPAMDPLPPLGIPLADLRRQFPDHFGPAVRPGQ